jgi:diaminopimelate epimerase
VGQCGNGSRAFALYVAENGLSDKPRLRVRTSTSVIELQRIGDNRVRVDMGAPRWVPEQIPLKLAQAERYRIDIPAFGSVEFGAVSMGNPHAVIVVDDVDGAPVEVLGRALQASPEFPQSVNVGFLQVLGRDAGRLRVYERGAGETLACGTGACAAAVVGRLWGLFDGAVTLKARGGDLRLEWAGGADDSVFMTGPAETVFTGEIEWQK